MNTQNESSAVPTENNAMSDSDKRPDVSSIHAWKAFTENTAVKESLTAQSKTPRSDAAALRAREYLGNGGDFVSLADARQLETELAEAKALFRDGPNGIKFRLDDWTFHDAYGWIPAPAAVGIDSDFEELTEERDNLRAQVERLTDAMTDLMDCQNGPPLETWAKRWNEAMDKCRGALESTNPSAGGEG